MQVGLGYQDSSLEGMKKGIESHQSLHSFIRRMSREERRLQRPLHASPGRRLLAVRPSCAR